MEHDHTFVSAADELREKAKMYRGAGRFRPDNHIGVKSMREPLLWLATVGTFGCLALQAITEAATEYISQHPEAMQGLLSITQSHVR